MSYTTKINQGKGVLVQDAEMVGENESITHLNPMYESSDYPQYTFQHTTTGVITIIKGIEPLSTAKDFLSQSVEESIFFFPEGDWQVIGVQLYTEEW